MIAAIVNHVPVQYDHILHNKDQVTIITDTLAEGPKAVSYTHLDVYKRQSLWLFQ